MALVSEVARYLCILLIFALIVNPPQNFSIVDPGYLGYLYLQWQPPVALDKKCKVEYELKYRSVGNESWKTIITKNLLYKDGFDLNKHVEGKLRTLLSKQCTNGSEVRSLWTEASYAISEKGSPKTKIEDMNCIYYNWEYLVCYWKPGITIHSDINYFMYFWHEGMDHTLQCSNYFQDKDKNIGCKVSDLESSDYKDFFICVNGSSKHETIRSSYFIFQLQNIVKPESPDYLYITVENSVDIKMKWNTPEGPIPSRCFTYEIVVREDDTSWVFGTDKNNLLKKKTLNESKDVCFFIRSKVNIYCADDGYWSEWSEEECWAGYHTPNLMFIFIVPGCLFIVFLLSILCMALDGGKPEPKLNTTEVENESNSYEETLC
uniref:Interleukin-13 receptor subunit alpha-2 n=1 Tax=Jaculus jaculus TaxID=51337 RepID=A0A8C5LHA9_JACJA